MDLKIIIVLIVILVAGIYFGKKILLKRKEALNPDSEDMYQESTVTTKNNLNPVTIDTQEFDNQYFDTHDVSMTDDTDFQMAQQLSIIEENISLLINRAISLDKTHNKEHAISYLEDAHNIMVKNLLSAKKINKLNETISYYRDNSFSLTDAIAHIDEKYEKASIQDIFGSNETPTFKTDEINKNNNEENWLEQEAKNVISTIENSHNKNDDEDIDVEDLLKKVIVLEPQPEHHPTIEELMETIHKETKPNKENNEGIDYEQELLKNINTTADIPNQANISKPNNEELEKVKQVIVDLDKETKK